jgi:hypothetical protein
MKIKKDIPFEIDLTTKEQIKITLETIRQFYNITPDMFASNGNIYRTEDGENTLIKPSTSFDNCLLILTKELERVYHE